MDESAEARNVSGANHPCVATSLIQLAQALTAGGRTAEARSAAGEARAIFEAHHLTSHPAVASLRQYEA